jgi:hypothetical protein
MLDKSTIILNTSDALMSFESQGIMFNREGIPEYEVLSKSDLVANQNYSWNLPEFKIMPTGIYGKGTPTTSLIMAISGIEIELINHISQKGDYFEVALGIAFGSQIVIRSAAALDELNIIGKKVYANNPIYPVLIG